MDVTELAREWQEGWQTSQGLPARFEVEYRIDSCLKYAREQQVYKLLGIWDDAPFLLKMAQGYAAPLLREEYRFLKELGFPFLPKAVDCFEEEGRVYLLREYLPGKTLYDMVEGQGALPPPKAVRLAAGVCRMLHTLHTHRPPLIHRDIKPQNILYSPQGTCLLLDLGSLRHYEPRKAQDTVVVLTQATAAPEQFGFQQSDMRTDVYAVGKLLYYLLTGHFSADEPELRELPVSLRRILRRCLSFAPQKRYPSAASLEKALRRWLRLRARRPALVSLAGVLLLGCSLAVGFLGGRMAAPALPAGGTLVDDAALSGEAVPRAQAESVSFAEPEIEAAVRLMLGKGADEPIAAKELGKVSALYIYGNQAYPQIEPYWQALGQHWTRQNPKGSISSLEDLQMMPNLQTVMIDRQPIWDLEPLTKLPWLDKLSLRQCLVRDLTPLTRCPWLQELSVSGNPLRDLAPVSQWDNLKVLSIADTKVTDISPLEGMKLDRLDIADISVKDYSVLETLSLRSFDSAHFPESAVPFLARIQELEHVGLALGHYRDLRPFAACPALKYLNVAVCEIDDLSDMSGFPLLSHLDLFRVKLPSLTPLLALPKLRSMVLSYATIDDISALLQFAALEEIAVDAALAQRIAQTFPGAEFPFQIIIAQVSSDGEPLETGKERRDERI